MSEMSIENATILRLFTATDVGKAMGAADLADLSSQLMSMPAAEIQGWVGDQISKAAAEFLAKGDFVGHPFRGNQYADSSGASTGAAGSKAGSPERRAADIARARQIAADNTKNRRTARAATGVGEAFSPDKSKALQLLHFEEVSTAKYEKEGMTTSDAQGAASADSYRKYGETSDDVMQRMNRDEVMTMLADREEALSGGKPKPSTAALLEGMKRGEAADAAARDERREARAPTRDDTKTQADTAALLEGMKRGEAADAAAARAGLDAKRRAAGLKPYEDAQRKASVALGHAMSEHNRLLRSKGSLASPAFRAKLLASGAALEASKVAMDAAEEAHFQALGI